MQIHLSFHWYGYFNCSCWLLWGWLPRAQDCGLWGCILAPAQSMPSHLCSLCFPFLLCLRSKRTYKCILLVSLSKGIKFKKFSLRLFLVVDKIIYRQALVSQLHQVQSLSDWLNISSAELISNSNVVSSTLFLIAKGGCGKFLCIFRFPDGCFCSKG